MEHRLPLVSVGMPTFNRPELLSLSLVKMRSQSYTNIEIIISDNCSDNLEVISVIDEHVQKDKRIVSFIQKENIGAANNFRFVLSKAKGEYFMWAADDDVYDKEFIEECMSLLLKDTTIKMAMTDIEAIDYYGRKYREVPSFSKFSGKASYINTLRYLFDHEFNGKANLIYSIYKKEVIERVVDRIDFNVWGADMILNLLSIIEANGILISAKVLLKKRNADYKAPAETPYFIDFEKHNKWADPKIFSVYSQNMRDQLIGTKYYWLAYIILKLRLIAYLINNALKKIRVTVASKFMA